MGGLEARSSIMAKAMVLCLSASCPPGSAPRGRWRAGKGRGISKTNTEVSVIHPCAATGAHLVLEMLLVAEELSFKFYSFLTKLKN